MALRRPLVPPSWKNREAGQPWESANSPNTPDHQCEKLTSLTWEQEVCVCVTRTSTSSESDFRTLQYIATKLKSTGYKTATTVKRAYKCSAQEWMLVKVAHGGVVSFLEDNKTGVKLKPSRTAVIAYNSPRILITIIKEQNKSIFRYLFKT